MLTAAVRMGTWQSHHLDAVLRGVRLTQYDSEAVSPSGCTEADAPHSVSADQASPSSFPQRQQRSSPTQRLQRAIDSMKFIEEAAAEKILARADAVKESQAVAAVSVKYGEELRPTGRQVHALLLQILRAAQHTNATPLAHTGSSGLPRARYTEVWSFLAWMQLHGYHVLSASVLDELSTIVDGDGAARATEVRQGRCGQSPAGDRVVTSGMQAMHRLTFLQAEREWLRDHEAV